MGNVGTTLSISLSSFKLISDPLSKRNSSMLVGDRFLFVLFIKFGFSKYLE